jgi:hypothetical protein
VNSPVRGAGGSGVGATGSGGGSTRSWGCRGDGCGATVIAPVSGRSDWGRSTTGGAAIPPDSGRAGCGRSTTGALRRPPPRRRRGAVRLRRCPCRLRRCPWRLRRCPSGLRRCPSRLGRCPSRLGGCPSRLRRWPFRSPVRGCLRLPRGARRPGRRRVLGPVRGTLRSGSAEIACPLRLPPTSPTGSLPLRLVAISTPAAAIRASHPTFLQRTRASQSTPLQSPSRGPFAPARLQFRC